MHLLATSRGLSRQAVYTRAGMCYATGTRAGGARPVNAAYAYTPRIWMPLAATVFVAFLGLYGWRRRAAPGVKPFVVLSFLCCLLLLGIALEAAAANPAAKIAWFKFQAAWLIPAVTAGTCFALEYAYPGRWLTRRNLELLALPPLLYLLLIVTNDARLIWWRLEVGADGSVVAYYGPPGTVLVGYGWCLVLINAAAFLWLFVRSPQHRWPAALMLLGQVAGRGGFLFDLVHPSSLPLLDPTVIAILSPWVGYAIALFGFRIFDPLPAAHTTAIAQMREGMVVLDAQGRVASLNPAAAVILGTPAVRARGRALQELLPTFPELRARLTEASGNLVAPGPAGITLAAISGGRHYALSLSPLRDFRGLLIGYLLLLHDVTEQKLAEAALRESAEKLRLIFGNAFDGIAIYEEYPDRGERRLLDCNERYAQMAGRSRMELLEMGDPVLVQKPLAPVPYARPREEIAAAQSAGLFSWVRPDGRENVIEYSAASVRVGGRLLTIGLDRDVTDREQAEARLLELRWAQAALEEREQLAHELHDSLSQSLGFLNLQAQAAQIYLQRGEGEEARTSLARLAEVARELQGDVRELIGNLLMVSLPSQGFCSALRQVAARFEEQTGLAVALEIADHADAEYDATVLSPTVGIQLLRIVQEALTNVRKHAGRPTQVSVRLSAGDGRLHLAVADNGVGFDPVLPESAGKHYGLQVMRQRAARIGGEMAIASSPGGGTRVEVSAPLGQGGRAV